MDSKPFTLNLSIGTVALLPKSAEWLVVLLVDGSEPKPIGTIAKSGHGLYAASRWDTGRAVALFDDIEDAVASFDRR